MKPKGVPETVVLGDINKSDPRHISFPSTFKTNVIQHVNIEYLENKLLRGVMKAHYRPYGRALIDVEVYDEPLVDMLMTQYPYVTYSTTFNVDNDQYRIEIKLNKNKSN